jgi:hypothetical protein
MIPLRSWLTLGAGLFYTGGLAYPAPEVLPKKLGYNKRIRPILAGWSFRDPGMKPATTHGKPDRFGHDVAKYPGLVYVFHATLLPLAATCHEHFANELHVRDFHPQVPGTVVTGASHGV